MSEPLRRDKPAPAGALIRMTRDSPEGNYRKGDMAVKSGAWFADFNGLGNGTVTGQGVHGVAARYYLVVKQNFKET